MEQKKKFDIYQLVKEKVRIEDVVKSYGFHLTKTSGNSYLTVCPFHDDTNASLSIKTDKQFFKCFSCGKSGTAVEFIIGMEQKNNPHFTFEDAILKLKNEFGLPVDLKDYEKKLEEERYSSISGAYSKSKISVIKMYEKISRAFQIYLINTKQGKEYLSYLEKRGLDLETISHFQIGFCPRGSIANYYENTEDMDAKAAIIESGLADEYVKNGNRNIREFFYDRITFPLKDSKGNTVGFTARTLDPRDYAKYKNSKESSVFNKSEIMYNYDSAITEAMRTGKIIVFEGNMDVISAYKLGLKNVIGLNGSAMSETQIRMLKKLGVDVILSLDNDRAGHRATIKNALELERNGLNVSCIDISDFGNAYKDVGDILESSLTKPEIKNDFPKKFMSLEKDIFEYRLKYEYFADRAVNSVTIKEIYKQLQGEMNSERTVYFKNFCARNSVYSPEDIQSIIEVRKSNDNLYAQLGLRLIDPILQKRSLDNAQKEIVISCILKDTDSFLNIENDAIMVNTQCLDKLIETVKDRTLERKKSLALKSEINARQTQENIFSMQGIVSIYKKVYSETADNVCIRSQPIKGFCKPENIIDQFKTICQKINGTDYNTVSNESKLNELSLLFYEILNLRMFDGPYGRVERIFIEKAAEKMGLHVDFSKTDAKEYRYVISESMKNNDARYLGHLINKITAVKSENKKELQIPGNNRDVDNELFKQ